MGIGLPSGEAFEPGDSFAFVSAIRLLPHGASGSSLCKELTASKLRVLPKMHTSQSGLTIRSLSHHLALCPSGEVQPVWHAISASPAEHSLNLLLIPWPEHIRPAQFRAVAPDQAELNMPDPFRFFRYDPERAGRAFGRRVGKIMDTAAKHVGRIDGVILPELALRLADYNKLRPAVLSRSAFLVCGVAEEPRRPGLPPRNSLRFDMGLLRQSHTVSVRQGKHHRWRLNRSQISQYGLGTNLDPEMLWWEHAEVEDRCIRFVAMRPWLTMCALICEDLARPDPAGDLVRAVGPNLVICLLMDGPQLAHRWPGRYATVLADDPGSSVLTLTSLGMSELSRPQSGSSRSRVVALWKDADSGPQEIELANGTAGIVLNITVRWREEFTADGRGDQRTTGYPSLAGFHCIG